MKLRLFVYYELPVWREVTYNISPPPVVLAGRQLLPSAFLACGQFFAVGCSTGRLPLFVCRAQTYPAAHNLPWLVCSRSCSYCTSSYQYKWFVVFVPFGKTEGFSPRLARGKVDYW